MDTAKHDVLAFTAFPKKHWRHAIWSNNPLERLNKVGDRPPLLLRGVDDRAQHARDCRRRHRRTRTRRLTITTDRATRTPPLRGTHTRGPGRPIDLGPVRRWCRLFDLTLARLLWPTGSTADPPGCIDRARSQHDASDARHAAATRACCCHGARCCQTDSRLLHFQPCNYYDVVHGSHSDEEVSRSVRNSDPVPARAPRAPTRGCGGTASLDQLSGRESGRGLS